MRKLPSVAWLSAFLQVAYTQVTCSGSFIPITAEEFVANLHSGWNLGNTLDAIPDEGSWNNAPVEATTVDLIKESGFRSVRLPVTWTHYFTGDSPDWTVDPAWLQRVSDDLDLITSRGLYVIVNVHHDSWEWADVTASANTAEDGAEINKLNGIFLQAIADAGEFNSQRVVNLVGGGQDSIKTSQWFEVPENITNPWAIQFHYYSPYDFIFTRSYKGAMARPDALDIVIGTTADTANSLPDSTEEASASEQFSSAYIFHQVGTNVTSQSLSYIFNGNSLVSITESDGTVLASGSDYSVSDDTVVFSATYLGKKYSASSAAGVIHTLTLEFNGGAAHPTIQIVQWDTPVLSSTSASASAVSGADLSIPITWNGLPKLAAMKALTSSGIYLFDDWTQWLGPLQQARATYSNHWNWDNDNVIITAAAIDAVVAAGETSVFTFEFYPRVDGDENTVEFMVTI
ncbi:glycoside hydrolase superfamily [Aspergillus desertorum]